MSHFTKIRTKIVHKDFLLKALTDMNLSFESGNTRIRGWLGQRTSADIKVSTKDSNYDIGFVRNADSYEVVADWYGIREFTQESFISQVYQRYSYHASMATLCDQGFSVVKEESERDGQIHLVLRRMA